VAEPAAESAYLFRHAMVRDAAYSRQLPADRAALHSLVADVVEALGAAAADVALHIGEARVYDDSAGLLAREQRFTRLAAEHAEAHYGHREAARHWLRLAEITPDAAAEALRNAGRALIQSGDSAGAEAALLSARKTAVEEGNMLQQGLVCGSLANLYQQTGRMDQAMACHTEALGIHRQLGQRRLEAVELGNFANLHMRARRTAEAEKLYVEALGIMRETGNRLAEGAFLGNLAGLYSETGRLELALQTFEQAFAILREVGDRRGIGIALTNLASLHIRRDRPDEAERAYCQALELVRETGNRRHEAIALGSLALLRAETGQPEQAKPLFEQALAIHADVQNQYMLAAHGCDYALCLVQLGDVARAAEIWRRSADTLVQLGDSAGAGLKSVDMRAACEQAGVAPFDRQPGAADANDGLASPDEP